MAQKVLTINGVEFCAKQDGTEVQTLIFSKEKFKSAAEAVAWAKEHDFKADKVDETDTSYRLRQKDPSLFDESSFRTINITDGVKAVIGRMKTAKAVWTTAYINDLPDSSFLYIAPGGKKDEEGKTTPRSLRYFPVRDHNGKLDMPHLRNALARIPQANIPQAAKDKARAQAQRMLEQANEEQNKNDVANEFPYVMTQDAVAKGYLPDAGQSELPWTLEQVVPKDRRYWDMDDREMALAARDELVARGWFSVHNTAIVDGLLHKIVKETYLYELDPEPDMEDEIMAKGQVISLFKTEKSDDEERYVLGVVLEPNDGTDGPLKPDTQGDVYSAKEIRQACHLFMEKFQNMGHMHRKLVNKKVKLVECYIAPATFKVTDPYGQEVTIRAGTWLMGLHIVDKALWKKVKEDDLTGLSIGGSARRMPEKVMSLADLADEEDGDDSDTLQAA